MRAILDALPLYPRTCVWELTSRCNLACVHCASAAGLYGQRGSELDSERSYALCEELADLGCEQVVLSGGEPLLRAEWPEIARRLVERRIRVSVISNGLLVDESAVQAMVRSGVSTLAISIDGTEQVHDAIRRRKGSFRAAMNALASAAAAGLRIHAVTHVNRLNRGVLEDTLTRLESVGVRTWLVQLSAPWGRLREHPEIVLSPEELPSVARWLADARARARLWIAVGDNIGYYGELEGPLRRRSSDDPLPFWCGCSAGCWTVGIEANGNVKGCLSLQSANFVEGNVRDRSLREIWQDPQAFRYTRGFESSNLKGTCSGCEYGEVCRGGCTFMAVGATGKVGNNPYCLYRITRGA